MGRSPKEYSNIEIDDDDDDNDEVFTILARVLLLTLYRFPAISHNLLILAEDMYLNSFVLCSIGISLIDFHMLMPKLPSSGSYGSSLSAVSKVLMTTLIRSFISAAVRGSVSEALDLGMDEVVLMHVEQFLRLSNVE